MNYKIQLISLLFSFIFGVFFYLSSLLNYKLIKKHHIIVKYLITFVYIIDIALLYVLFMYKINYGIIHIYFIVLLFLGYYFGYFYTRKIRKFCKIKDKKLKD